MVIDSGQENDHMQLTLNDSGEEDNGLMQLVLNYMFSGAVIDSGQDYGRTHGRVQRLTGGNMVRIVGALP